MVKISGREFFWSICLLSCQSAQSDHTFFPAGKNAHGSFCAVRAEGKLVRVEFLHPCGSVVEETSKTDDTVDYCTVLGIVRSFVLQHGVSHVSYVDGCDTAASDRHSGDGKDHGRGKRETLSFFSIADICDELLYGIYGGIFLRHLFSVSVLYREKTDVRERRIGQETCA